MVVDLFDESPVKVASKRPHGKGTMEPEGQSADGGAAGSWGETLVIWLNLEDPESGASFILDDPTEAYL